MIHESKMKAVDSLSRLIPLAVNEDIGSGDITSAAIFGDTHTSSAVITAKSSGIFCGSFIPAAVYAAIDRDVRVISVLGDCSPVLCGDCVVRLHGKTSSLLAGERIVLNFMQRMSGIATQTFLFTEALKETAIKILDTRKTVPGLRMIDKYSVLCGGGTNHRIGLYDMVMIKDNHIKAAGSITQAVEMVRSRYGNTFKIEVETTTLEEVAEAAGLGVDIIMLDNMDRTRMQQAAVINNKRCLLEISGNMDIQKIIALKDLDINFISVGALTHSVEAFDLSMKFDGK